ncbi:MAG: hypothetical protein NTW76_06375 [Corynebacteriales bacterium]|nr:hypothetical protein [Mycobacteriales bacterium]
MPPPSDYAARRRAVIRQYHPDVGGDPQALHRELARLDREFGRTTGVDPGTSRTTGAAPRASASPRPRVRPTSRIRRLRRSTVRTIDAVRAKLPRSVPGAKRYFEI